MMAVCAEWIGSHVGPPIPRVGVAVLLCRNERVLVGRRKMKTYYDEHALPGGLLEFGETFEECAMREVEEETGMHIQNIKLGTVVNTILLDDNLRPTHYVTVFMKAEPVDLEQEPETLESDKCDGWLWADWPAVPTPMFKPLRELVDSNYDPFL